MATFLLYEASSLAWFGYGELAYQMTNVVMGFDMGSASSGISTDGILVTMLSKSGRAGAITAFYSCDETSISSDDALDRPS
ncbi:hypothetical protein LTR86_008791 [Recurvomyces mirabilis]|nr:hypothetical protein LTR86_008791 [Recurvomyces mirabilis]